MIVKRLYRKIKTWHSLDNEKIKYDDITDYVGYYLFGIIPIYLKQIDKYTRNEKGFEIREDVIKKYKNIIN